MRQLEGRPTTAKVTLVPRPDRIVPVSRLPEGLRLCANNVRDFVVDAENLIAKGHGWHAIALAMFAYEELGKYDELLRHRQSAKSGQDSVNVKDAIFSSHTYKYGIASKLIPEDAKIIVPEVPGFFDSAYFDSAYFDIGTPAVTPSDSLRAQCVYVDWVDDDWRHGTPHDTDQIKRFLNSIIEALNKLEAKPYV
jgi:AbiV family abortive infection protein